MEIIKINPRKLENEKIRKLIKSLKEGKVVVCPTDTVYGLICKADDKKALRKIISIKKRSLLKPIPIFVGSLSMAKKLSFLNKKQEVFLKKVWPGATTAVLKAKKSIPFITTREKTIGLRMPDYNLILSLIKYLKYPLAETSINISGKPPLSKIKDIVSEFKNKKTKPDIIVDVGNLLKAKPSVVLDLTVIPPKILRK
ncbi:MAG: L-threonylcarbamoyladenylate synthase [Candidatus Nealsonbacteria bacterium]